MAIDTSGKWWVGSEAADIADYLKAYQAEGHEVNATRLCRCHCGSTAFELKAPNLRAGRARNANARPVTLQSASPSMNLRKGNNPTCAGSRSASAVRTVEHLEASSIGKSGTVRLTTFSIRPKAAATSHWVAWKNWPKQRLNWVINPGPAH